MALQIGKLYEINKNAGMHFVNRDWKFICRINDEMTYRSARILAVVLEVKRLEPEYKRTSPLRDHLFVKVLLATGEVGTIESAKENWFSPVANSS